MILIRKTQAGGDDLMKKIIGCKLVIEYGAGNTEVNMVIANIKILDTYNKQRKKLNISFNDVSRMLSGKGSYILECDNISFSPEDLCNPGGDKDFGWIVSLLINAAYYYDIITKDKYISLVREHFDEYYLPRYYSKSKLCLDFFNRYFLSRSKYAFGTYENMFQHYEGVIKAKGRIVYLQKGGKFCGCYYDDYNRCRPITSPKYYEKIIPIVEKLWVCFSEEVNAV